MCFEVTEWLQRKMGGMYALCDNWANTLEGEAKTKASWKDRSSHARQALHGSVEGRNNEYSIYLSHGVEYGEILEEGSKPHIIKPKNAKALYWKGAAHPVKEVHHPGTKGFKTIETTLEGNKERIKNTVIDYWSDD